jgi:hypothetical protein
LFRAKAQLAQRGARIEQRDVEAFQVRRFDGEKVDPRADHRNEEDNVIPEWFDMTLIRIEKHPDRERALQRDEQGIVLDKVEEEIHERAMREPRRFGPEKG